MDSCKCCNDEGENKMKSKEWCECCFVYGKATSDPFDKSGSDVWDC